MEIFNLKDPLPSAESPLNLSTHAPKTSRSATSKGGLKNQITALRPALHDQNRVNVFLDDRFAFSLDLTQVVDYKLKIGKFLSEKEKKELESASEFGKLYTATLEWVFIRPRSEKETRDYLKKKLYRRKLENQQRAKNHQKLQSDPSLAVRQQELRLKTKPLPLFSIDDIDKVIKKLVDRGYLDDRKFAIWYIENRNLKKGASRRRLEVELSQKGIEKSLISELLESSSRSDEAEIKKILEKKGAKLSPEKLLRRLISAGFPYDLSKQLLEEYMANR